MYSVTVDGQKTPPTPTPTKKVIIIGAGVGGLATAARLARAGVEVTVLEKNDFSGGRCSLIHRDGFRFDRGPSFYLMPEVFEDLFDDLNERVEDWYSLKKCEPNYIIHYDDKQTVTLSTNLPMMKAEIEKYEGKDGWARYLKFLAEGQAHYESSIKHVLLQNFPNLRSILKPSLAMTALKIHVFDKLHRRASNYFWTERLRRAFTFSSMYLGMSPYDAPATYNLLQYTELAQGIWYPEGGFHALPRSLESITKKNGGKVRYSSPVKKIILSEDKKKTQGVELENGERLESDIVISNADLVWTYKNLLPTTDYSKTLERSKLTCSSLSFYWGLKKKIKSLVTHQVYLSEEYKESFNKIFNEHWIPNQPSFYINIPSKIDSTAAPKDKDSMIILVPIGHLEISNEKKNWEELIDKTRNFIIKTIEEIILKADDLKDLKSEKEGIQNFKDLIEFEILNTPHSWSKDLNLYKGSILGLSHNIFQVINFRPRIKHDSIDGMYFVGASTHPGTGVPVVACGSKLTSEKVLKELKMKIPWNSIVLSNRKLLNNNNNNNNVGLNDQSKQILLNRTQKLNLICKPKFLDFERTSTIFSIVLLFFIVFNWYL